MRRLLIIIVFLFLSSQFTTGYGRITREYQQVSAKGLFELQRTTTPDSKLLTRYAGSYSLGNNKFIWISVDSGTLIFGEGEEGRGGGLIQLSETEFIAGSSLGVNHPIDVKATFIKDDQGEIKSLKWQQGNRPEKIAQKVRIREEEVKYKNGDITLAGTLVLPPTKGPHPALILVTGSGPALRDQFGGFPYMFASIGIATLVYDKRGCGASTGTYHDSLTIEELATDVLAGVEYLKTRADIDARQIGLRGDSQGAWVVPYAAAQSNSVSFLIVKSASALDTWENGLYEMEYDLRLEGFSDSDVVKARNIGTLFNEMLFNRGEGWAKLRSAIEATKNEKWFRLARIPDSLPETPAAANFRWVERERKTLFNPQPFWEKIKVPVLVVNGGMDRNVPGKDSATKIEMMLKKAGNKNCTIKFYPNADHHLWIVEKMGQREGRSKQVGVYQPMIEWLLAHTRIAR
jgi:pimeloyl-ACP methyl ester carboxylesterase